MGGLAVSRSWERVLAAMEADAARAAALLTGAQDEPHDDGPDTGAANTGVPATWRLPTPDATTVPTPLPDPGEMPPIPDELRDRIVALREQILQLQGELASAMAEVRNQLRPARRPDPEPTPGFMDRTA